MIIVRDVAIEVGARRLITDADFTVNSSDKVGLVGPNGAGKTTLMRTIAGELESAAGSIVRSGVVGYLAQEAAVLELADGGVTALERILTARSIGDLERRMESVRVDMETATSADRDKLIHQFAHLEEEFTARGGYVAKAEAKRFAAALGISNDDLEQPVPTMSGGQRRRVELARILFAETDVLILDEPTNHLDLDAKAWLMAFLADYPGGLLVISHDLALLDQSITSVLSVENGEIESFRGNYSYFLDERSRRRSQRLRQRRHQDEKIERLEEGIRRFKGRTEKMAKRARSWETRVAKLKDQRVEIAAQGKTVTVKFPRAQPLGKTPILAKGLAKAFEENLVFVDVDVDLNRDERLVIMGLNGAGKTTLLRILAGVAEPDLGEVERDWRTSVGYYAQEHEDLKPSATVFDHMREVSGAPDLELRSVLGHFLLADKTAQAAGTLSGGERTKLALARLVVGGHNMLLLDEPTNNLDPKAKDALVEALELFIGSIVLVSHDSEFVERLAPDRVVLMPEGSTAYFDESMLELVALA